MPRLLGLSRQFDRAFFCRPGWPRIVRNTLIGFIVQAGTRMAAALSYYALFAAGPTLVLTIALGGLIFGEGETRQIVALAIRRVLPPSADAASAMAEQVVRTSAPATTLAIVTGCFALIGFTRALTTSLNVMLNLAGSEPIRRTVRLVPLLYLSVVGLLWGSWVLTLLARFAETTAPQDILPRAEVIVRTIAPLFLAWVHFAIILRIVPRVRLAIVEVLVPAAIGAALWEGARHLFGWLIGTDSFYLRLFGSLGADAATSPAGCRARPAFTRQWIRSRRTTPSTRPSAAEAPLLAVVIPRGVSPPRPPSSRLKRGHHTPCHPD
jgi:membrane protein